MKSRITRILFRLIPYFILCRIARYLPYFKFLKETADTQTPINLSTWFNQKIKGHNRDVYWPVHPTSLIQGWQNILIGVETSPGLMPGCYIQGGGKIIIGDYTQIGPHVGIISANHDLYDNRKHHRTEAIEIGPYCWLGMKSVILPGVKLGPYTVVAAGAIVTKSFPEGYCVIGGNPAKVIRVLEEEKCVKHKSKFEYNGYIPAAEFQAFRKKYLNL